jgi:hypothetical protein
MNNLDYYSVMESRIKYYQQKYDPQNKLGNTEKRIVIIKTQETPIVIKRPVRKKIVERLDSVIALFL